MKKPQLDTMDFKLLEALQEDARTPFEVLAERANLSPPACYRRVRRLRSTGAIEKDICVVDPKTMGWTLSMLVLVSLERERGHAVDRLVRALSKRPEVVEAWLVTGDHDFVLRIVARDMQNFDDITSELLHGEELVRSFKTLVVIRHVKPPSALRNAAA